MSGGGGGGLERNLKGDCGEVFCGGCFVVFSEGGCVDIFCGGYLDITWHLLESCFTAFLRRAAFTAYFEAAFFVAFFRGSCFVAFFGGGCFAAFFRGGCFATFLEGRPGATAPLAPYKNHHCLNCYPKKTFHFRTWVTKCRAPTTQAPRGFGNCVESSYASYL